MVRKKAQKTQKTEENIEQENLSFIKEMERTFLQGYASPQLQNQILKNINGNPIKYSSKDIKNMLASPEKYEDELKYLSEFLFNYVHQFKRLVMNYAKMLTFDWYIVDTNADDEDRLSKAYQKSNNKAINFIEGLNLKLDFADIVEGMILDDAKFYYIREFDSGTKLQELPSDFCLIKGSDELGYTFYFDMTYFLQYPSALD